MKFPHFTCLALQAISGLSVSRFGQSFLGEVLDLNQDLPPKIRSL